MEPQMMAKKRPDGDGTPDKTEKKKESQCWMVGWSVVQRWIEMEWELVGGTVEGEVIWDCV